MGKNYYVVNGEGLVNQHDGGEESHLFHIGKSSYGWTFALHVYPKLGINTLQDWMPILESSMIHDDCGTEISADHMIKVVTQRRRNMTPRQSSLFRMSIGSERCAGHGEGPYDYVIGDFC